MEIEDAATSAALSSARVQDSEWPLVSIVFLAYNRRDELAISLDQVLGNLDYPADRLEVIVVDNASADGTADMLRDRFGQVTLIRNPVNVGASAWNVGMSTARGDWRMILDDDCYISGDALKTAVRRAGEERADFVSFRVESGEEPGYYFNDEYQTGLLTFWGCSAMFTREVIETEPFYDPEIFIWANEAELTMRLLDRGFRHLYLAEVTSLHQKPPNPSFSEKGTRLNHLHWAYIAGKHLRGRDAAGALVNLLLRPVFLAYSEDRRALGALPNVPRGFVRGLRSRAPVRPEVSRVYRRHFHSFLSPLPFLRSPLERLRTGSDPAKIEAARTERVERWLARRPEYYPADGGVLEI
jgi:GT2 family glycosyltransferase